MYGGGAGDTSVTNAGGGDRGARLTVAEGVVLREACVRETTSECRDKDGIAPKLPPDTWEERDCGTSAYCGTCYDVMRAENESAYSNANETNGTSENPPATRRRTRRPSLSEQRLRRPKPLRSSLRIRFLTRLD